MTPLTRTRSSLWRSKPSGSFRTTQKRQWTSTLPSWMRPRSCANRSPFSHTLSPNIRKSPFWPKTPKSFRMMEPWWVTILQRTIKMPTCTLCFWGRNPYLKRSSRWGVTTMLCTSGCRKYSRRTNFCGKIRPQLWDNRLKTRGRNQRNFRNSR